MPAAKRFKAGLEQFSNKLSNKSTTAAGAEADKKTQDTEPLSEDSKKRKAPPQDSDTKRPKVDEKKAKIEENKGASGAEDASGTVPPPGAAQGSAQGSAQAGVTESLFTSKDMIQGDVAGIKGLCFGYGNAGQLLFKAGAEMTTNKKIAPKTVIAHIDKPGKVLKTADGFQWSGS